jgi:cation/acetate symporter
MSLNVNIPVVNPRLGASFAVFTSSFFCLVLLLMILEQLGVKRPHIGELAIVAPVFTYLLIGITTRTTLADDYFISGQRVPAVYNGLALSAGSLGGLTVIGLTGALFFGGVDVMAICIGLAGGLALSAVFFSSYLRKAGAFTMAGFLGLRFDSTAVRLLAAVLVFVPSLMLLAAEIKFGAMAASYFLPMAPGQIAMAAMAVAAATVILGGMRALTWTQCGQTIVLLCGLAIPVIWVSLQLTNLPLPQLTYGNVLKTLSGLEETKNLIHSGGRPIATDGFLPLTGPFAALFSNISRFDFVALLLCTAMGSAVLPGQIARLSTTPVIPQVRKSFNWALVFTGVVMITLPAIAVFVKYYVAKDLSGVAVSDMPPWGQAAQALGLVKVSGDTLSPAIGETSVLVRRDGVLLLLPIAGRLPFVLSGVLGAAVAAAVLAAAAGHLLTIANTFSNDVYSAALNRSASPGRRLLAARLAIAAAGVAGVWLATMPHIDPLRLGLRAISLNAGTFFAVLFLAVWWTRTSAMGAAAGMLAGFAITAAAIVMTPETGTALNDLTAGVYGALIAAVATVAVSLISRAPGEERRDFVDQMHLLGGETLYARSLRLAARGRAKR